MIFVSGIPPESMCQIPVLGCKALTVHSYSFGFPLPVVGEGQGEGGYSRSSSGFEKKARPRALPIPGCSLRNYGLRQPVRAIVF